MKNSDIKESIFYAILIPTFLFIVFGLPFLFFYYIEFNLLIGLAILWVWMCVIAFAICVLG